MSLLKRLEEVARKSNDEAHVRVGRKWMTCAEYRDSSPTASTSETRKLYDTLAPHLAWARVDNRYRIVWLGTRRASVVPYGANPQTVMGVTFNDFCDWYGFSNKEAVNG